MPQILSIINQKKGVGKTTVSINLAYELASKGKSTLFIDLDPQANSSRIYCKKIKKGKYINIIFEQSSYTANSIVYNAFLQNHCVTNLNIIPTNINLALLIETVHFKKSQKFIQCLVNQFANQYEYIILDCPPTLNILVTNAIYASDIIITPIDFKQCALDGIDDLLKLIQLTKLTHKYKYYILRNMYERRKSQTNKLVNQQINKRKDLNILDTIIKKNSTIQESQSNNMPVKYFKYNTSSAHDFQQLVIEILSYA